ncbi:acetyl-CoA hydrolase/transferase C-terminal domain-containing protein [Oscillibacter sp.]|uniref:acetyl-CoA hydrolase/transferase family protein n=1 Tax=Oscillibacter sp. TaxID=1945593 RepID=UPI0026159D45|nr:acetyl-CoA hydrolase/transferase C-terminal domain-containing protein [Oscillibacter sp.]MDD3347965.1 acetyl-CoA hydrolase/transferase C-terminal domain-containing protein [Oscillibacter sp.]
MTTSAMQPVRRGRLSEEADWHRQYEELKVTAEEAAALIQDGDGVAMPAAASWPYAVDEALVRRLRAIGGRVELYSLFTPADTVLLQPENRDLVEYYVNFLSGDRALISQGNVHFVPTHLSEDGAWICDRHPRVTVITCAPPDENGWMSRSISASHLDRTVLEQSELVIVEVNPRLPALSSDGECHLLFHVSEADAIVESDHPLAENIPAPATEVDETIAGYIAEMVPNGACVQFGLGGLPNAIGECLAYAGKRDLGLHTEVVTNCAMKLMEQGVVNNSRKQLYPGRSVGALCVGDRDLWAFANGNRDLCFKEVKWVNDPRTICQNDGVVSINNAMEIDLTGQVNAESVGPRMYSGTGGQLEWVTGAQWSKGGKSIIALRSSYRDRSGTLHSKILPQLSPGGIVTTPRTMVQYVATEYGVANLKYRSCRERAKALIAIAHPAFREELERNLPL